MGSGTSFQHRALSATVAVKVVDVGSLTIRTGFWGTLYFSLVMIRNPQTSLGHYISSDSCRRDSKLTDRWGRDVAMSQVLATLAHKRKYLATVQFPETPISLN